MTYRRKNRGTCSRETIVTLERGIIREIEIVDGCEGNLQGIQKLLRGRRAAEMAALLQGIDCEGRGASCPDQIAQCLAEALAAEEAVLAQNEAECVLCAGPLPEAKKML